MKRHVKYASRLLAPGIQRVVLWVMLAALAASVSRGGERVMFGTADGGAEISIRGTSTLHGWEVECKTIRGTIGIQPWGGSLAEAVSADAVPDLESALLSTTHPPVVNVTIPVQSLQSGKRMMDREMFKALNAGTHSTLVYTLGSVRLAPGRERGAGGTDNPAPVSLVAEGALTLNGQTRQIVFPVEIAARDGGLRVKGETTLKMTDFGIAPPRLMMGALRTGDDVTIGFVWEPNHIKEN